MLKSNQRAVNYNWVSPNGESLVLVSAKLKDYKRKQHSKYSWSAKNYGKDLIYQTRLRLAEKMGLYKRDVGVELWSYLYDAYSGIVLQ